MTEVSRRKTTSNTLPFQPDVSHAARGARTEGARAHETRSRAPNLESARADETRSRAPSVVVDRRDPASNPFVRELDRLPHGVIAQPLRFAPWVPQPVRDAILERRLPEGLSRFEDPHGRNTIVWTKRGDGAQETQMFQEFPENPQWYAERNFPKASIRWLVDSARTVNLDRWLLLQPKNGEKLGPSPQEVRSQVLALHEDLLEQLAQAFGEALGAARVAKAVSAALAEVGHLALDLSIDAIKSQANPIAEAALALEARRLLEDRE